MFAVVACIRLFETSRFGPVMYRAAQQEHSLYAAIVHFRALVHLVYPGKLCDRFRCDVLVSMGTQLTQEMYAQVGGRTAKKTAKIPFNCAWRFFYAGLSAFSSH